MSLETLTEEEIEALEVGITFCSNCNKETEHYHIAKAWVCIQCEEEND